MFRDFLGKMKCLTQCSFCNLNHFVAVKIVLANGRVVDDLRSPNTFDTRLGERASANVQPWLTYNSWYNLIIAKLINGTQ